MRSLAWILLIVAGCEPDVPRETAPARELAVSENLATPAASAETIHAKAPPAAVRVAAVQCYSRMGALEYNRTLLTRLIREAAEGGAKIVVLPECAVTGYMDSGRDITWTSGMPGGGELAVRGPSDRSSIPVTATLRRSTRHPRGAEVPPSATIGIPLRPPKAFSRSHRS